MGTPVRVLAVEDSEIDFFILQKELSRSGFEPVSKRVDTLDALNAALAEETWDLVIVDYTLPACTGIDVLHVLKQRGVDLPSIIVSGTIDDETAVAAIKAGARDCIMKTSLARLGPAVKRELREANDRRERGVTTDSLDHQRVLLRQIIETSPNPSFIRDREGRYLLVNRVMATLYNLPAEEMVGKTDAELGIRPEETDFAFRGETEALDRDRTIFIPEEKWTLPSGETRYFQTTRHSLVDERGMRTSVLSINVDITERKRKDEALRASEKRYQSRFEHSTDAVLFTLPGGKIITANPAACRMFGYSEEELTRIGGTGVVDPEDRRLAAALEERARTGIFKGELTCVRRDKTRFPVELTSVVFRDRDGNVRTSMLIRDLSEVKKMETALRQSEARFRELFENMHSGVAVYDALRGGADFLCRDINKAGQRIYRVTHDEVVGRSILDELPGARRIGLLDALVRVWKTGRPELLPVREYRDQRISLWVENYIYKLPSGEIVAIYDDITERKQAEEALAKSEEQYRSLATTADNMCLVDRDCRYLFLNDRYAERHGLPKDQLIGGFYRDYHCAEETMRFTATVEGVIASGSVHRCEHTSLRDGRTSLMTFSPVKGPQGQIRAVTVVSKDITERKQAEEALAKSEEQYRSLATSADNTYVVDREGRYLFLNDVYAQRIGLSKEQLIGKFYRDVHSEEVTKMFMESLGNVFDTGNVYQREHKSPRDGGIFLMTFTPVTDRRDQTRAVTVVSKDITDRKQVEDALRRSGEQLRAFAGRVQAAREEERTQIAREIHDELGGALTAMKIDFSLLARTVAKVRDEALKESLHERIDDMTKLIDANMQTIRRIAMGLRPGILDDLGLVAALEWQLADFQKRTGIRCEFTSSNESVDLDGTRVTALFRIAQEALTNVARHARATKVRIRLQAGAGVILLEVDDDGVGIKDEEIRSEKSLGLLGMRERALSFGGRLIITGRPGGGTIVAVESPSSRKRSTGVEADG